MDIKNWLLRASTLAVLIGGTGQIGLAADPSGQGVAGQTLFEKKTQKSFKGSQENFTGEVQVEVVFPGNATAHYSGAYVTFQPGARTAWHAHPAGQHMVIVAGSGLTGTRDGKIVELNAGDALWCPPDTDHWHGAKDDTAMTHLVITGIKDGENVVWKEKVTDQQARLP